MSTDNTVTGLSNENSHQNSSDIALHDDTTLSIEACTLVADDDASNDLDQGNSSSLLENSYEIIRENQRDITMDSSSDTTKDAPKRSAVINDPSEQIANGRDVSSSDSSSRGRPSGFLSKLTSSTSSYSNHDEKSERQTVSNLPSSFANLISSVSFTSGFRTSLSIDASNDKSDHSASKLTIETASTATSISSISGTKEQILNRKATLERKNLISLTKLIVKDLISSSLNAGRTIDDQNQCAIHLNNYFTLLDRVLKHGLKQNILTNKAASLWSALDSLPKYLADKRLTSETVRSLAHTKTPDGKIKAWLRIAMMQKKLPEYFNELLANKSELLKDIYHDYAFMMNDDAQVFAGLIIGVNVIDCNFFVKDDNFDMMDDLIDLSPYLKAANSFDEDDQQTAERDIMIEGKNNQLQNLTAILDQKNYLEERSVMLESTINCLRDKIKQLEEQNSRLEMEAQVNEVRIQKLIANGNSKESEKEKPLSTGFTISDAFKNLMNPSPDMKPVQSSQTVSPALRSNEDSQSDKADLNDETSKTKETISSSSAEVNGDSAHLHPVESMESQENKKLRIRIEEYEKICKDGEKVLNGLRERIEILETSYRGSLEKIRVLEHERDTQNLINCDREKTINIYEKDLREKQNLVESLQKSIIDAKKMNSDLSDRLSDTNAKLKDRINMITNLQTSLDKWKLENKILAAKTTQLEQALKTIDDLKKYNEKVNDELKRERECGKDCSNTVEVQTGKIVELTGKVSELERELTELRPFKDQIANFKRKCQDYEQSLEEVGYQLRESRLEVESLRENSSVFLDSQWMDSKQVKSCALCQQTFSVTRRKHHCRLCGNVFCQTCSDNKMELASSAKPARVCDTCHAFLLAKFVKSSSG